MDWCSYSSKNWSTSGRTAFGTLSVYYRLNRHNKGQMRSSNQLVIPGNLRMSMQNSLLCLNRSWKRPICKQLKYACQPLRNDQELFLKKQFINILEFLFITSHYQALLLCKPLDIPPFLCRWVFHCAVSFDLAMENDNPFQALQSEVKATNVLNGMWR